MNNNKEKEVMARYEEVKNRFTIYDKEAGSYFLDDDRILAYILSELQHRENDVWREASKVAKKVTNEKIQQKDWYGYDIARSDISSTLLAQVKE